MGYFFLFLLGATVGSFLNVLIDRLPNEKSILGRSHCDYCKKTLAWYDLIPILSFLWLRGRCEYCGRSLSLQYPIVEILTGVVFLQIFNFQFSISNEFSIFKLSNLLSFIAVFGIVSSLIVIFFADAKYRIIPDSMQVSLLVFSGLIKIAGTNPVYVFILGVRDGLLLMIPILLIFLITRGKGMGFGDVKLASMMGFLLGLFAGLIAIYIGFVLGAIVGVVLIVSGKKKMKSKIAFGPFLIIGTFVMLFWGGEILKLIRIIYNIQ